MKIMKMTYSFRCTCCTVAIIGALVVLALSIAIPYISGKFGIFFLEGELGLRFLDWACIGSIFLLSFSIPFRIYLFTHNPERETMYKFILLNAATEPIYRFARCRWQNGVLIIIGGFLRLTKTPARELKFDCAVEVDVHTRHQLIAQVKLPWEKKVIAAVFSNPTGFSNAVRCQFAEFFSEEHELAKIKARRPSFRVNFGGLEFKLADIQENKGTLRKRAPNWLKRVWGMASSRLTPEES